MGNMLNLFLNIKKAAVKLLIFIKAKITVETLPIIIAVIDLIVNIIALIVG